MGATRQVEVSTAIFSIDAACGVRLRALDGALCGRALANPGARGDDGCRHLVSSDPLRPPPRRNGRCASGHLAAGGTDQDRRHSILYCFHNGPIAAKLAVEDIGCFRQGSVLFVCGEQCGKLACAAGISALDRTAIWREAPELILVHGIRRALTPCPRRRRIGLDTSPAAGCRAAGSGENRENRSAIVEHAAVLARRGIRAIRLDAGGDEFSFPWFPYQSPSEAIRYGTCWDRTCSCSLQAPCYATRLSRHGVRTRPI